MTTDKDSEHELALKYVQDILEAWGKTDGVMNVVTRIRQEAKAEALREAAERVRDEKVDDTGTEGDTAYNMAIDHAISAILADSPNCQKNLDSCADHIPDAGKMADIETVREAGERLVVDAEIAWHMRPSDSLRQHIADFRAALDRIAGKLG